MRLPFQVVQFLDLACESAQALADDVFVLLDLVLAPEHTASVKLDGDSPLQPARLCWPLGEQPPVNVGEVPTHVV